MTAATLQDLVTADEFAVQAMDGVTYELIDGKVRNMSPAGGNHGFVGMRLLRHLDRFVSMHQCGELTLAETGFLLARNPDTVRAPDIAFIATDRVAQAQVPGFIPIPPDLAVEVNSPHDSASRVTEKIQWWLDHGTRLVWVVDLPARQVTAYHPDHSARIYTHDETLDGGDVLPGFTLPLVELFR